MSVNNHQSDMDIVEWNIQQFVVAERGSSKSIAEVLGMSQQVLLNKVSPTQEGTHLSIPQSLVAQKARDDYRILNAQAEYLNHVCLPKNSRPIDVVDAFLSCDSEKGDVARTYREAKADGVISLSEEKEILKQLEEFQDSINVLKDSIRNEAKASRGEI